ncbi:DHA1 family bicyclomycin/chloramphenicol resistance-like MFS transporter [Pelomonas saccharophila]|uniref:Bcr/CflA family efflux transporter n=1 Tax=Roseateles saccharophilus TaxID=304 RepID=A0ABU1YJY4_ROSSA|nr:Bcr/CflA family efflux MFS transporter [Roseateles saccharophilus]MDR7269172.1 DHA1 family bicyclomycin/chloramphenicol resistance-like MFS transporter [Roseateles saccharophilus]
MSAVPLRWLLTLAALSALATLSTNILLPSLPVIAQALGGDEAALTASVLGVFLAVFAFAQLIVGPLSDRIGRRPVVLGGLVVFVIGSAVCGVAGTLPWLLAGRALQAIGVAAASVLARAAARDRFEGPQLAALLGRIMVVMAAAPGFSPLLGGLVQAAWGWRALFAALVLAGLALAAAYIGIVGETLPVERRRHQPAGALARGYVVLLGDARFMRPALATAAILGALFAFFGTAPLVLARDFGFSALQVGLFFATSVFVVFAAGQTAPRWAARWGGPTVLRLGAALAMLGGLVMLAGGAAGLAGFGLAVAIFLFGMGLVSPTGTALALTPFASQAGQASALLGFLQMAAAACMTTAAATLPGARMAALALVLAGGGLLALLSGAARPAAVARAS